MIRRFLAIVVLCTSVVACAGGAPERREPKQDVGHGSVEEVAAALAKERLPCTDTRPEDLQGMEQRVSCRIGSDRVTLVHFFSVEQAREFERSVRAADDHGVFHDLWGAVVPTRALAERISVAVESTSYS